MAINYSRQQITDLDIKKVSQTLKSDYLTTGPQITLFENSIKKKLTLNIQLLLILRLVLYIYLV